MIGLEDVAARHVRSPSVRQNFAGKGACFAAAPQGTATAPQGERPTVTDFVTLSDATSTIEMSFELPLVV
ncbi:hypothetical protein GCM10008170_14430 [Methylopila capsulata]|uniref:Uncharacterized protein n=1 Tax=Methylopila capsulata TaxID=61654 RepID=A0A9W6MRQ5_9HYPH|nr:hypothetical protein GCM10008170_14430 [Methylopila capsulata]